jgi:hypothetical protein
MAMFEGRPGSKWPVSGSVLVQDGAVYFTAGHSSFLDGGIQVYKLDPATGEMLDHARVEGPRYDPYKQNPFYKVTTNQWGRLETTPEGYHRNCIDIEGARADILVSDGVDIRMGQTRITPELETSSVLREKAAGTAPKRRWLRPLHLFLDDTYYHRAGWHYSDDYLGGANAAGAANAGKLLVFDDKHSFAMQWEWEPGGRYPNHVIGQGSRINCDSLDTRNKGWRTEEVRGFSAFRREDPVWRKGLSLIVRGMILAPRTDSDGKLLFVAGPVERREDDPDPLAPYRGEGDGKLVVLDAAEGKQLAELGLPSQPVFDGMAAAGGRLFISMTDGSVVCLEGVE